MFSLASGVYQSYFAAPQLNILVIGCESVGKTALLERVKVTEFSTSSNPRSAGNNKAASRLSCPAPRRYSQAVVIADEVENDKGNDDVDEAVNNSIPSSSKIHYQSQSSSSSMEDVPLMQQQPPSDPEISLHDQPPPQQPFTQFNLKKGHTMLPLTKIRPTSGTNLAKVPICGCTCKLFDVSGKFQDLWVKYYGDSDAVLFCWRLGWNEQQQRKALEEVRRQVDDVIPVLIFGHDMGDIPDETSLLPSSTSFFIPHYTSNMMQVYCGSAKTGKGVREAMEWLVPLAKRQIQLKASSLN